MAMIMFSNMAFSVLRQIRVDGEEEPADRIQRWRGGSKVRYRDRLTVWRT
jgi:hypothetical protein